LDSKPGYEQGGFAQTNELIIVPLQKPFYFGVGKTTSTIANGNLDYQWLGNLSNNNQGPFQLGWKRTSYPQIYYADKPKHHTHKPYMGSDEISIMQKDLILHGFTLTATNRLPAAVRRALDNDIRVGGDSDQPS
jgi:hypothetical protein